ncbi:MAG: hypothetical protein IZT55_06535 [Anaerolineae bacterium]|nr:hypothetical protein [Anaerolineae bacterium]
MTVKLLMTWNITPGREQDYFEFVVREFIPKIQQLGLETTDAWITVYGDRPQILAAAKVDSGAALHNIMTSEQWEQITTRLLDYVSDLEFKPVIPRTGFQM